MCARTRARNKFEISNSVIFQIRNSNVRSCTVNRSEMANRSKQSSNNGELKCAFQSTLKKAFTANSQWHDKDEFLDVIYWLRQVLAILLGIIWGIVPLKGFFGLALFALLNSGIIYIYFMNFQQIDEEEFGGIAEITKEGFMVSMAGFLVAWIIVYSGLHF